MAWPKGKPRKPKPVTEPAAQLYAPIGLTQLIHNRRRGGQEAPKPIQPNIPELIALARSLLDPEAYGHAVNEEIRNQARRALGIPETKP